MSKIIDKQIYHINSANRISGTDENFFIELNDYGREWTHVVVLDAAIPISYYNVRDGENSFQVEEDGFYLTITVPPANYTRKSLATVLASLLSAASSYTYAVTYPTGTTGDTGKYTFTFDGSGINPKFTFDDKLICQQLGFDFNSVNTFSAGTLISTNVTNLASEDNIYIRSNICANRDSNIIQHVIANTQSFSNIIFENKSPEFYKKVYNPIKSNLYQFFITDEFARIIALNGVNWVCTVALLHIV